MYSWVVVVEIGVGIVISGTVSSGTLKTGSTLLMGPYPDGTFKEVFIRSIHCKRTPVEDCLAGDSCAVSLRATKRKEPLTRQHIRRGMVLVHPSLNPRASRDFEAEVHVLHHPTTIKLHYQAVIHCGIIRQTASIESISKECLRTGDSALVRFKFMMRAEYLHPGMYLLSSLLMLQFN
jgi:GTPase